MRSAHEGTSTLLVLPSPRELPAFLLSAKQCPFCSKTATLQMLTHFVIVLRHLRTPPERPAAFRRLCLLSFCVAPQRPTLKESPTLSASPRGEAPPCGDEGQTNKTLAFCQKRTSTLLERKMRSRRRPRLRFTQAACFRVSSSCRQYEVFGNFAWRNAPPRKRVTQSEKAPDCETVSHIVAE